VWVGAPLQAIGVVVLRELPRTRDTLLLRLLGRDSILKEAIDDLGDLPEAAKEREIAYEPLVALRLEVEHDPRPDKETREYLMATNDLYEQWKDRVEREAKARGRKEGRKEGRQEGRQEGIEWGIQAGVEKGMVVTLLGIYAARFGEMAEPLRKALTHQVDASSLERWTALIGTGTAEEIAAALRNGTKHR
jgi:flagellar biosynthesis/type III secretory pathway protein FliH